MYDNIKMIKLVSGETVIGKYSSESDSLKDVVLIQTIPSMSSGGVQIALLPYGFPYEDEINAEISFKHSMYEYKKVPEDLKSKYMEAKSNIKIASSLDGIKGDGGSNIIL